MLFGEVKIAAAKHARDGRREIEIRSEVDALA
jgi:hypothetical protein